MKVSIGRAAKELGLEGRKLEVSLGQVRDAKTGTEKPAQVTARRAESLPDGFEPGMVRQLRIVKEGRWFYAVFTVTRPVAAPPSGGGGGLQAGLAD